METENMRSKRRNLKQRGASNFAHGSFGIITLHGYYDNSA